MYQDYIIYKCKVCHLEFILPEDSLRRAEVMGRYLSCNLGHRQIKEVGRYDDYKECMDAVNTYERRNGSIRQKRHKHSD